MNPSAVDPDVAAGLAAHRGVEKAAAAVAVRTRVKICGLTRAEDALAACRYGADAVGLIFYPPSPRGVELATACDISGKLPPFVTVVGVFVNPDRALLNRALSEAGIDVIQFHGDEDRGFCESFGKPYIKAVRVQPGVDLHRVARDFGSARALLLDSFETERRGGTGRAFDWSLIPRDLEKPFILAGGLRPDNVAAAIAAVRPYAVDGNGGVESSPGVKDHQKIEAFIQEVNSGQIT